MANTHQIDKAVLKIGGKEIPLARMSMRVDKEEDSADALRYLSGVGSDMKFNAIGTFSEKNTKKELLAEVERLTQLTNEQEKVRYYLLRDRNHYQSLYVKKQNEIDRKTALIGRMANEIANYNGVTNSTDVHV